MTLSDTPGPRIRSGVWIAVAAVCALVTALALLPLIAEVSSAVSGEHVWTMETVVYAVLPITAIVIAWVLATSVRRAGSARSAVMRAVLCVLILIAGCTPLFALFVTLANLAFRPAP